MATNHAPTMGRRPAFAGARRRVGRRLAVLVPAVFLLAVLAAWAASLRLVAATPDPYNVGAQAVARFHQLYPLGIPLTVRVAETNIGWLGACEGIAYLRGERVTEAALRPDGALANLQSGSGRGLWIVDVEAAHGLPLRQVGQGQLWPGPPPPWPLLLPLGPSHPLGGSLQ